MQVAKVKLDVKLSRITFPILIVAIVFAVLILASLALNKDVIEVLQSFYRGTFGTKHGITAVMLRTTPLLLTGVAVALAFRARIINIGAEGQLYIGALISTWAGLNLDLPQPLFVPILFILSFLGGGAWASVAAFLKVKFGTNEFLVTFMMNFVAIFLTSWAILGPLKGSVLGLAQTDNISQDAILPVIDDTRIHVGIVISILVCIGVYYFLNKTKKGFEIRTVGSNTTAARTAGINTFRSIMIVMLISGGIAGIAGMIEVTGIHHRLLDGISPGYGYTGIVIALIPNLNPLGVIPTAFLFGTIYAGTESVHRIAGLPIGMVYAIQGIVLLAVISLRSRRIRVW
ncbi:ABC transporter permease [soil metagenome]